MKELFGSISPYYEKTPPWAPCVLSYMESMSRAPPLCSHMCALVCFLQSFVNPWVSKGGKIFERTPTSTERGHTVRQRGNLGYPAAFPPVAVCLKRGIFVSAHLQRSSPIEEKRTELFKKKKTSFQSTLARRAHIPQPVSLVNRVGKCCVS